MATTIGSIQLLATIDTSSYKKGVKEIEGANKDLASSADKAERNTSGSLSGIGSTVLSIGSTVAKGLAVAGSAIIGLVGVSVKSYAEYEQLVGGVDTLFKDSSDKLQEYASKAYQTAGISGNKYMEQATSFSATLLQGLGGDTAKATDYANKAIIDMSDNANKMGTSIEMIQNAYQGFAKDNYMMLDNLKLGYGGTATEMARLVNDSGAMGDSFVATAENVKDIPFDKLIEAIHITQTELGITGTTAEEASTTISGSFGSMKASWSDLMVGMTSPDADIGALLDNFMGSVDTFGSNVMPAMTNALSGIVDVVGTIFSKIVEELPNMLTTLLPKIIETFTSLVTSIATMLPVLIPVLIAGFFDLLTALLFAVPLIMPPLIDALITLVTVFVNKLSDPEFLSALLGAAVALFLGIVQAIPLIIIALVDVLPILIDNVLGFLLDPKNMKLLIKASADLFMALVYAVPEILGALFTAFGDLIGKLWTKLKVYFTEFAGNFGNSIGQIFKNAINGVLGFLEGFINKPVDLINGAIKVINKIPGVNVGLIGRVSLPRLAEGGIVSQPTLAMVGEGKEPEAVIPLSRLDKMLGNSSTSSSNVKININMSGVMTGSASDERAVARRLVERLNEELKSKGMAELAI